MRWVFNGRTFGDTFIHDGDVWTNGTMSVPSHPNYIAATGTDGSGVFFLRETGTGFTVRGGFAYSNGGFVDSVDFSGIGTAVASGNSGSVAAPEPAGLLLTVVGLAGALRLRRRVSGTV